VAVDPRSLPKTIEGARAQWSIIEETWATTVAAAQGLQESSLHAMVNGKWSFVETQRHLLFVTDAWIVRTILGSATPHHRFGLPPHHRIGEPMGAPRVRYT
jgi:hypothetical protein